jgi:phosphate:Na+ symporter
MSTVAKCSADFSAKPLILLMPTTDSAQVGLEDTRAAQLCAEAMRNAISAVGDIAREKALSDAAVPIQSLETPNACSALAKLEECAKSLSDLRRTHRSATLSAVGAGEISADQALARIETVRRLEALTLHVRRAAAQLLGHDDTMHRRSAAG